MDVSGKLDDPAKRPSEPIE